MLERQWIQHVSEKGFYRERIPGFFFFFVIVTFLLKLGDNVALLFQSACQYIYMRNIFKISNVNEVIVKQNVHVIASKPKACRSIFLVSSHGYQNVTTYIMCLFVVHMQEPNWM